MIRVPIGGTDFSTHTYAYNEYPPYDSHLTNFTLAFEDYQYKVSALPEFLSDVKLFSHGVYKAPMQNVDEFRPPVQVGFLRE